MHPIIYKCPKCNQTCCVIIADRFDIVKEGITSISFQCDKCLTFLELRISLTILPVIENFKFPT